MDFLEMTRHEVLALNCPPLEPELIDEVETRIPILEAHHTIDIVLLDKDMLRQFPQELQEALLLKQILSLVIRNSP